MSEERGDYKVEGRAEPRRETRLPFASEKYRAPSKEEFRTVTQLLGLTGAQVAKLVGAEDPRTVRRWIGGERAVPYAVWRLLLIDAGLALPDPGEPSRDEWQGRARAELAEVTKSVDATMQASVLRLEVDFSTHETTVYLMDGDCVDMTGCIDFCRAIDPGVRSIATISGADPDTSYRLRANGKWEGLPA